MWGPLDQDHRHRFTTSWVCGPAGRQHGRADEAGCIGGWQWTGVMQFQTGRPFNVTSGTDNSLDGIGNDRAKLTGVSTSTPPARLARRRCGSTRRRSRSTMSARSAIRRRRAAYYGPSLHSWDMGLFKNFRFSTDMNVQFRAEFFNIFNQVNFDIPNTNRGGANVRRRSPEPTRASVIRAFIQFGLKLRRC